MTTMSPALKKAVKEYKDNLQESMKEAAETIKDFEARMEVLNQKITSEQQKLSANVAAKLEDAMEWDELPAQIDNETLAALYYYVSTEQMAESHFKGTVVQDFIQFWEANSQDQAFVQGVQQELGKMQADIQPLAVEQQQMQVEMQMSNPMPFPPGQPILRAVTVPPEEGSSEWQVALVPFMIDENLELKTEDLPFEYYAGVYTKSEGASDNFNTVANVQRLGTSGEPAIYSVKGTGADGLFIIGHVEANGEIVGPITMPPLSLERWSTTSVSMQPPTPQGGGNGPRLLN